MTIDFRSPGPGEEPALRDLFTEAFGDAGFTDLFFRTGYSPDRCLAAFGTELLAAQYWFDCTLDGKKAAYLYGIAAFEACRGKGIGSRLVRSGIEHLQRLGYEAIFLVPAEESLFSYYERFGFRVVSSIREFEVRSAAPLPIRKLTVWEYAEARKALLPKHALVQEGPCLALLDGYADFYATQDSLAAVSGSMVWELLGKTEDAPGILAALGLKTARIRTPGDGRPFSMAIGAEGPVYLGLALD